MGKTNVIRALAILGLAGSLFSCENMENIWSSQQSLTTSSTSPAAAFALSCQSANDAQKARIMVAYRVDAACGSAGNYTCESTTFSPDANAQSSGSEQDCVDDATLGHVCLTVDTSTVPSQAGAGSTVFHCSNTQLAANDGFLFQSRASSLEAALSGVVGKCQSRSQ